MAAGGDEVFRHLVLARIIEPVSKLDSLRVLEEAGAAVTSYRTLLRRRDSSKSLTVFSLAGAPVAGVPGGGPGRCGVSLP